MYNIFFISDTHFSHQNAITFLNYDGSRMRPFDTWEEADEIMIQRWNEMVSPNDKIYHLGDVTFSRTRGDLIMPRLNGTKVLIKGNHDKFQPNWYLKYFKDIRGSHNLDNYILTHFPVHPESKGRFKRNIHGHIHGNLVTKKIYFNTDHPPIESIDYWYRNVCVDLVSNNYFPVPFDTIKEETMNLYELGILEKPLTRREEIEQITEG